MLCFTWWVSSKETQFLMGKSFLANMLLILAANVFNLLKNNVINFFVNRKKKAIQKKYEEAFLAYKEARKIESQQRKEDRAEKREMRKLKNTQTVEFFKNLMAQ